MNVNKLDWFEDVKRQWGEYAKEPNTTIRGLAKKSGLTRHKAYILYYHMRENQPTENIKNTSQNTLLHTHEYYYNDATDTYVTFISHVPKPIILPGHVHRAMKRAYSNWDGQSSSINEICRRFEIPRTWFENYKKVHGWTHDSEPFTKEEILEKDTSELVSDALQIRRQVFYQQYEIAKWNQIQADAAKWNRYEQETLNKLIDHFGNQTYVVPTLQLQKSDKPYALVIGLSDLHWGAYAWDRESGINQNRKIIKERLQKTTSDIINRLHYTPEEIIVPIGGDFFDIDGDVNATTKGTVQDIDGTPTEILITGCNLARDYIDIIRQIAPVRVVMIQGNHDRHNGLTLLMFLHAWYNNTLNVTIDMDYSPRAYVQYGNNLLAFSHGDGSRTKTGDLASIMATEARSMWGNTEHHIVFSGHLHFEKSEEYHGLMFYQMPSLCTADRWHTRNGYPKANPTLQAYLIDRSKGIGSILIAHP